MTIHYIIKYCSYFLLITPVLLLFIFVKNRQIIFKKSIYLIVITLFFLLNLLLIYSRFIEPNIIIERNTRIETGFKAKIALISDIHIGVYNSTRFLERVVQRVNNIEEIDFIVIAGDITYNPDKKLDKILFPLKDLKKPAFAVLGNHDSQCPGPNIEKELGETMSKFGITFLKNEVAYLENLNINILGLGDYCAKQADVNLIEKFSEEDNLLVIAHSPDTIYSYKSEKADITLSGDTHGGQIRVPFIYEFFIPSKYGFNQGYYNTDKGKVYVSSGLGLTGLPFRLAIPPTIDIIELY